MTQAELKELFNSRFGFIEEALKEIKEYIKKSEEMDRRIMLLEEKEIVELQRDIAYTQRRIDTANEEIKKIGDKMKACPGCNGTDEARKTTLKKVYQFATRDIIPIFVIVYIIVKGTMIWLKL